MTDAELIGYLLVFALTVVWSMSAFGSGKAFQKILFSFISWIFWWVLAILHIGLFYAAPLVSSGISWLWWGLGFTFFAYAIAMLFSSWQAMKNEREWQII
jgi:hypothetical protein